MATYGYGKTRAGRSFHVIVFASGQTRCGRYATREQRAELPLGEKSCEPCLRLTQHDADVTR
jgi:hypothetical protein